MPAGMIHICRRGLKAARFLRQFSSLQGLPDYERDFNIKGDKFSPSTQPSTSLPSDTIYMRTLPDTLTNLRSDNGRQMFKESILSGYARPFFGLTGHYCTQSEPTFCGLTSLAMVLNALEVDPGIRWKGCWRWFSDENVLSSSAISSSNIPSIEDVRNRGLEFDEFGAIARHHSLSLIERKAEQRYCDYSSFLSIAKHVCQDRTDDASDLKYHTENEPFLGQVEDNVDADIDYLAQIVDCFDGSFRDSYMVVNFSRAGLGQTGIGHYSPIGAYHEQSDSVLILDVARFKYPAFWVRTSLLWDSMLANGARPSRGYFVMSKPKRK